MRARRDTAHEVLSVAEADAGFIALMAAQVVRDARDAAALDVPGAFGPRIREQIAGGTLHALLWVLGSTDLAPASGRVVPDPSVDDLVAESVFADQDRAEHDRHSDLWCYLGGIADGLAFAAGLPGQQFWWVPLPEGLRVGPPRRDETGRTLIS